MSVNIYDKSNDSLKKVAGFVDKSTIEGMSREIADLAVAQTETNANVSSLDRTITGSISDAYNSEKTYTVGEYCIDNNQMWKCKVPCKGQKPSEGVYWTARKITDALKRIPINFTPQPNIAVFADNANFGAIINGIAYFIAFFQVQNVSFPSGESVKIGKIDVQVGGTCRTIACLENGKLCKFEIQINGDVEIECFEGQMNYTGYIRMASVALFSVNV